MLETEFVRSKWNEAFRAAVVAGLSRPRKTIAPCWLYDERGSQLFEQITGLDAYYPTRAETEILLRHAGEIARFCGEEALLFEYGAGAGIKTEILIGALDRPRLYVPIDIAGDFLARTAGRIGRRFPDLDVFPVVADFNHDFELPATAGRAQDRLLSRIDHRQPEPRRGRRLLAQAPTPCRFSRNGDHRRRSQEERQNIDRRL